MTSVGKNKNNKDLCIKYRVFMRSSSEKEREDVIANLLSIQDNYPNEKIKIVKEENLFISIFTTHLGLAFDIVGLRSMSYYAYQAKVEGWLEYKGDVISNLFDRIDWENSISHIDGDMIIKSTVSSKDVLYLHKADLYDLVLIEGSEDSFLFHDKPAYYNHITEDKILAMFKDRLKEYLFLMNCV